MIYPNVVESELADTIFDNVAREAMKAIRRVALKADAIARALTYAIEQPDDMDVSEMVVRPTASPH